MDANKQNLNAGDELNEEVLNTVTGGASGKVTKIVFTDDEAEIVVGKPLGPIEGAIKGALDWLGLL